MLQVVGLVGYTFFFVGDIPFSPSIMFVDIHVERAHVNKRYEKLTEMLTRTGSINVYFTDIQHFIIFYECPKSQTEVNICAHICVHICAHICVHICAHICAHICVYICAHICVHICAHICVHICAHVCAHILQVRIQKFMSLILGFSFIEHNRFTTVDDLVLNIFGSSNHYNS